jgi:hypothetical protein
MATKKTPDKKPPGKDDNKKGGGSSVDKSKRGPVRSMMVGESPGEDPGYDPDTIPTEDIPDDD